MSTWKKLVGAVVALVIAGGAGAAVAQVVDNAPTGPPPTRDVRLLGNGISENKFVPIIPCRILDTRKGLGKLQVGQTRVIDVRGDEATFSLQGGNPGGCGIPKGASAVEATMTAVDSGNGFLRAWPASLVQPNATFLNYTPVFNASNTGAVTLCGANGLSCTANQDLNLRAYGTATHMVIDIAGYYVQPMAANVAANGSLNRGSRVVSTVRNSPGQYTVTFDRRVAECTYFAGSATANAGLNDGLVMVTNAASSTSAVYVRTFATDGTLLDKAFQVEVIC